MENSGIIQGSVYEKSRTLARNCLNCAEIFWVRPDQLKRGLGNFCSQRCCGLFRNTCKSDEHRKKISDTMKLSGAWAGEDNPKYSGGEQTRKCLKCGADFNVRSISHSKKYCSRSCSGLANSIRKSNLKKCVGPEHWNWKGGISTASHLERTSANSLNWRKLVFVRDGYVCSVCGTSKPRIHAHHIFEWSKYPELRYDVDNGVTLCSMHHQELHPNIVLNDTRKYFLKTNYRET